MSFESGRPQPAVKLTSRKSEAAVGASKLGGTPDVGSGFAWPQWKGRPLQFLGQVNLADVARFPFASVLPPRGLLGFFYDGEQETWGYDPKDKGSWLVHFEPDPTAVEPMEAPGPIFEECVLEADEVETLPPDEQESDDDVGAEGPQHRLLGHPSPIQGDMQLECEIVSRGLFAGDSTVYKDPRIPEMKAASARWRLLAQIDSDDDAAMMWGDLGRLYFWITEDALRRRAFDEVWMVLQCS